MYKCKALTLSLISALMLFVAQPALADKIKWKSLTSIQQDVLKKHAGAWDGYSEDKQQDLLKKWKQEITRKNEWKSWFKGKLSKEDRKAFTENKNKMSPAQFRKYVKQLLKKYK